MTTMITLDSLGDFNFLQFTLNRRIELIYTLHQKIARLSVSPLLKKIFPFKEEASNSLHLERLPPSYIPFFNTFVYSFGFFQWSLFLGELSIELHFLESVVLSNLRRKKLLRHS